MATMVRIARMVTICLTLHAIAVVILGKLILLMVTMEMNVSERDCLPSFLTCKITLLGIMSKM